VVSWKTTNSLTLTLISTPGIHVDPRHQAYIFARYFTISWLFFAKFLVFVTPLYVIIVTKYYLDTDQKPVHTILHWGPRGPQAKPAKYSIKIWWNYDAVSSYPLSGQVYLGMQPDQDREINQGARVVKDLSILGFAGQLTLVSYAPKKNDAVILLSSLHSDQAVDGKEHKPEIISHYNAHNGSVDNIDHLAGTYSFCETETEE